MNGKQLKNSILQLAIQGKLVPQDANDEPASELVKRLKYKKDELVKNKVILRKSETKPFLSQESLDDLNIPESWEWVQLSDVSIIQEGAGIRKWQYRDAGTQGLCGTNIFDGKVDLHNKYLYISEEEFKEKYTHLKLNCGDIVTACSGGSWGKTAIFDSKESIMLNTSTLRLRFFEDIANTKFLYYLTKSSFFKKQLEEQLSGMQPNFGYAHYSRIMIPLPPLSEQQRIVAKIEELLPLVDEYDKAQTQLDTLNQKLPEALKKSILQEAIMGKLVPQDPNDEPASVLLQRIRKEKEQLVKDGKLKKKDLVTTPITDEEKPFEIPESWEWVRLSSIAEIIGGFAFPSQDIKGDSGTRVVRISDFNELGWVDTKIARYNDKESLTQYELKVEDILMAMTGGTVGKSYYVTYLPERMILNQRVAIIRTHFVLSSYIDFLIKSPLIQDVVNERKNSTNDNISMGDITGFLFPLPPLSEQHRIVAKIEELFAILK